MTSVDYGRTATDYGKYRQGFPDSFFERISTAFDIGRPGQRAVDVGTGTGDVARGLARRGCETIGLDLAPELLEEGRRLDREAGVHVDYRVGSAEETGLDTASVEVLSAGKCWHWFNAPRAVREAERVIEPGGQLLICQLTFIRNAGSLVEAVERLILEHNSEYAPPETENYPEVARDVSGGAFHSLETFSYEIEVPYSREAWRGRVRASYGVSASLSDEEVRRFDDEHRALLDAESPSDPLLVGHRVSALVARRR